MRRQRASIVVDVDLDPVPGWGNTAEDYAALIRRLLNESIPHYRPEVTVMGVAKDSRCCAPAQGSDT